MKSPEAGVLVRAFLAGFHEKLRRTGGERLSIVFVIGAVVYILYKQKLRFSLSQE